MTRLLDGHLLRSDSAHADEGLLPSAAFELHGSTVSMTMHDPAGVSFLFDCLLHPSAGPTTVSLRLQPGDYRPENLRTPEFPPSNAAGRGRPAAQGRGGCVAGVRSYHRSHQWLPLGDAWRPGMSVLVMDPGGPDDSAFPREAYVTIAQLRDIVDGWAWGAELPPAGVDWTVAGEREVRWSWF